MLRVLLCFLLSCLLMGDTLVRFLGNKRIVIECNRNNALHSFDQKTRVTTFVFIALEIAHFSVHTFIEPLLTPCHVFCVHGERRGDAASKKAEALCFGFDVFGGKNHVLCLC